MATRKSSAKRDEWEDRLERFDQAAMTVAKFCIAEDVSVASFYQWRRKLRGAVEPSRPRRDESIAAFTQIRVSAAPSKVTFPSGVEIVLGNDIQVVNAIIDRLLASVATES